MTAKRIVITGSPGSGKTTLIKKLEKAGYNVMHEISRAVIKEAQAQGIEQLFLEDPLLFSKKLLEGRLEQFHTPKTNNKDYIFYDRGMPDVTAYMDYIGASYSEIFEKPCYENQYDAVFILPPWSLIYTQDNERYESFAQAEKIHEYLIASYKKYGYTVFEVPKGNVNKRIAYILRKIEQL